MLLYSLSILLCYSISTAHAQSGRCGSLFRDRVCDCQGYEQYCNTDNGWCGDTSDHRDAQAGDEYDCPSTTNTDGEVWTQLGVDIDGVANGDKFGRSVSMSTDGKTVAAGAHWNDENGSKSGQVRIADYDEEKSRWIPVGNRINGAVPNEYFGWSVSLSSDGRTVAISAYGGKTGAGGKLVRVYSYSADSSTWIQVGDDIVGEDDGDMFGVSVSMSKDGKIVAAGAIMNDDNGFNSGHVLVHEYSEIQSKWIQLGDAIQGKDERESIGKSISLSGDGKILAIGMGIPVLYGGSDSDGGHVRIYQYVGTNWIQLGNDIDGESAGDYFGMYVSISLYGNRVATSAKFNDANGIDSGRVSIYEYYGLDWILVGDHIYGETAFGKFGTSLSMSQNGERVAIGTSTTDQVRIYSVNEDETAWYQVGDDINGENLSESFGTSVSMSSNGKRLAVGAPLDGGKKRGIVRTFKLTD